MGLPSRDGGWRKSSAASVNLSLAVLGWDARNAVSPAFIMVVTDPLCMPTAPRSLNNVGTGSVADPLGIGCPT